MWKWYVYKLFDGEEVVYVGKGCGDRLRVSSRVRGYLGNEVARFKDEADALAHERQEILSIKPRLNCTHVRSAPRSWDQRFAWLLRRNTKAASAFVLLKFLGTHWFPSKEAEQIARDLVAEAR